MVWVRRLLPRPSRASQIRTIVPWQLVLPGLRESRGATDIVSSTPPDSKTITRRRTGAGALLTQVTVVSGGGASKNKGVTWAGKAVLSKKANEQRKNVKEGLRNTAGR